MPQRVLVVDDHEANRYFLQVLLESHGYEVGLASNGREALEKAREKPFDLVVSDLLMPEMDGYTLLGKWVEDPVLRKTPFVVYTGTYTESSDEALAFKLGARDYLVKPLEHQELLQALEAAMASFVPDELPAPLSDPERLETSEKHSEALVRKLTARNRELELQQQRLMDEIQEREALLDAMSARVAILDAEGVIVKVNKAWKEFAESSGLATPNWGIGLSYLKVADAGVQAGESSASGLSLALRRVLKGQLGGYFVDYPCHSPSAQVWYRLIATPLAGSREGGALIIHLDVTEQKLAEAQLLRAQRLESIGTLAGGIAHDLNNTLMPVLMAVDLLKIKVQDRENLNLLETVEKSIHRGSDLVRQLLLFARGAEGRKLQFDIRDLVEEVLGLVRETFPKKVQVSVDYSWPEARMTGDPTQLQQVLLNLCLNARDAMPQGGTLSLVVRELSLGEVRSLTEGSPPGRFVCLEVSDTGEGIREDLLDQIFDPFFTTKEIGKGTGLGLSTALAIVNRHGGKIEVASRQGVGTTFRVYLPTVAVDAVTELDFGETSLPRGDGELILVVDDEVSIRQLTQRLLEMSGYRVLLARHGGEALELFDTHSDEIKLVLTDMMMPVMDGPALIANLLERRPNLKIVACSGLESASEEVAKTLKETFEFLSKPYSARELLTTLYKVLRS